MTIVAVLLVLLINLVFTCFLISALYYLAILPIKDDIKSFRKLSQKPSPSQSAPFPTSRLEGILPDLDDLPEESLWGDEEEDFKTRPEDLEEQTDRPYNTYTAPRVSSLEQLRSLNPDASS